MRNVNTWQAAATLTDIIDIVEDQENIDFVLQSLQADPMMTSICNNMSNRLLANCYSIGSQNLNHAA